MMHRSVPFAIGALALSACVPASAPAARGPVAFSGASYDITKTSTGALTVRRVGQPFANWEGAEARRAADRFCGGAAKGSIQDRFQGGAWLIVGGCV